MPLAAVGSSVSVIDREQIEARQSVFAIDLLADIPGFAVSRSGGVGSQTQVRVRGAEANQLLVLIDGIEANDPAGNDEFAFENLTTWDIERIEVVRGPQSALWGSDALSGVVNVITRQPTDAVSTQGFAEAGSFNTWSGGARLSGKLLGTRTGFSVSHVDSDGINNSLTGDEKDGYRNTTATLTLAGNPATNLALDFIGRYTGTTKAYDTTDFVVTGLPADSADVTDVGLGYFRAGGSLSLMDGQWTQRLRTAWTTTDSDNRNEFGANGSMAADKYGVYYQTTWHFGADSRGVPRAMNNTGNAVTLALEHEREEFSQRGTATPFGDPNQDQNLETSAAVLELLLTPVDRLSVSLSGRYDHNSDFDSVSTARVTTTWSTETTGTRLHASFGTGQKAPTFSERYGFYADQFVGNPDLKPETSTGWELGFEQQLLASRFGDRFTAGATYFHEDLKDEIDGFVFDPTSSLFTAANLEGKSHRRGVEAVLNARIADDLNVSGSYTYVDATQPDAGSGLQTREIRRPQNSASFNVNWRFLETRAQLNANLNYTGHQYDTYFEVAPPFGTRTINLQNYYLLGIAASYRVAKQTQVYARLENALNEHYAEVYGYNTPRRNVYAGFRLDF
ncbi:MAG: TonB-dependent receptor [Gammaproteobacteria bacterium]